MDSEIASLHGVALAMTLKHLRQKPSCFLLVGLVSRVFGSGDAFAEIGASLEEDHQQEAAGHRPVDPLPRSYHAEEVEHNPDRLLGGIVGVAHQLPEAGAHKAFGIGFGQGRARRFEAALFFVEIPLLLVGDGFHDDKKQDKGREHEVHRCDVVVGGFQGH